MPNLLVMATGTGSDKRAIAGAPVDGLGLEVASEVLANGSMSVGLAMPLTLERDGKPVSATVVAAKW